MRDENDSTSFLAVDCRASLLAERQTRSSSSSLPLCYRISTACYPRASALHCPSATAEPVDICNPC